jgi:spermidine synthase
MIDMLLEKEGKFDIIIDDGPHTWESQEWFFENYYDLLNEGGVLLCEDIHGQHYNQLHQLSKKLKLYVLDLRANNNPNGDEIIALRYKNPIKKNAIVIPVYNSLQENEQYKKCISTWEYYCQKHINKATQINYARIP